MFIYLIIEIVSSRVRITSIKAYKFTGFILNSHIQSPTVRISETSKCLKPTDHIIPVQFALALNITVVKQLGIHYLFRKHIITCFGFS